MPRSLLPASVALLGSVALVLTTGVVTTPSATTLGAHIAPGATVRTEPAGTPSSAAAGPGIAPTYVGRSGEQAVPGVVLVAPAAGADREDLAPVTRALEARPAGPVPGTRAYVFELPDAVSVEAAVRRYERDPDVAYAEPDYVVAPTSPLTPNDTSYPEMWGLNNTGQTGGVDDADIDAPEAWGATVGSASVVVAVVDEGVQISHPDLRDNVWTNTDEIPGNGVDDDENGYVDDVHGWDFYHDDASVYDDTGDDHGTHVAGTIAATGGNGEGVTGVAWRAQVMPLKFLGPDGGSVSDAAAALDYAVANGARISNNSWGGNGNSRTLRDAIARAGSAGHLFVAAAGNEGLDLDSTPSYPAAYDLPNLVSVAATDHADQLAPFSNYGSTSVDLAAPGVRILSTLPPGSYGRYSGTSMAAPHVAGVAALLLSAEPTVELADLRSRLLDTVDPVLGLSGKVATGGRLNAARALQVVEVTEVLAEASPDTVDIGATAGMSGRVMVDGAAGPDRSVELQQRSVGASSWSAVSRQVTDALGAFVFAGLQPAGHTDYRVLVDPEPVISGLEQVSSEPMRISVRAAVTLTTSEKRLRLGSTRVLRGTVVPAHDDSVRIVVRRNGTKIGSVTQPVVDSAYAWSYTPPSRGRYSFVTAWRADGDHLGARSPRRVFRVR